MNRNPTTCGEARAYLQNQIRRARKVRELRREMEIEIAELKEVLSGLQIENKILVRHNNDMRMRVMQSSWDVARPSLDAERACFLDEIRLIARACDASSIAAMQRMGLTEKLKQP